MDHDLNKVLEFLENEMPESDYLEAPFPFRLRLSMKYVIDHWRELANSSDGNIAEKAREIIEKIQSVPGIEDLYEDREFYLQQQPVLKEILSSIYLPDEFEQRMMVSSPPFIFDPFFFSPTADKFICPEKDSAIKILPASGPKEWFHMRIMNAYGMILNDCYGIPFGKGNDFIVKIIDTRTGLRKYMKMLIDKRYIKAVPIGKKPEFSRDDLDGILKDLGNARRIFDLLPPDKFEFHGFVTFIGIEVSFEQLLSELKRDLLDKESIISSDRFGELQSTMRSLLELPELKLGLVALPENWQYFDEYGTKIGDSLILGEDCQLGCESFMGSIYDRMFNSRTPQLISSIKDFEKRTQVEEELEKSGIGSLIVAPLMDKDNVIGIMEVGSPKPGDLDTQRLVLVDHTLSLFATAVKRSVEEYENTVQKTIKEECTAIHPSVEWRFRKAAVNLLAKRRSDGAGELEDIVFENVWPLYGLSDIRNSSQFRNETIQADLSEHLTLAKNVLAAANKIKPMPLFDELTFRLEQYGKSLQNSLSSGDELNIIDFIRKEVESLFDHISGFGDEIKDMIVHYNKSMDPKIKTFYAKRKDYEESVALINDSISNYLDHEQWTAQNIFPHYFEKYKTDGVEHSIYIGDSLVADREFCRLYLKNMRIWQLMSICGIAKLTDELKKKLIIPLETTHLVLVQDSPLSIRFRPDEKKFDVDGTYNIRYEIMKKRIDKAIISGSKERLTQPGKIAIVYSHDKEATEYVRYIEFLQAIGFLKKGIETLDLDEMQGVHGLKALRVEVNLKSKNILNGKGHDRISKEAGRFVESLS